MYLCHKQLYIGEDLFLKEILSNIQNADCPIDSIILGNVAKETGNNEYKKHKWSKYGTDSHPIANYEKVQAEIAGLETTDGNCRLYYDFVAWKQK